MYIFPPLFFGPNFCANLNAPTIRENEKWTFFSSLKAYLIFNSTNISLFNTQLNVLFVFRCWKVNVTRWWTVNFINSMESNKFSHFLNNNSKHLRGKTWSKIGWLREKDEQRVMRMSRKNMNMIQQKKKWYKKHSQDKWITFMDDENYSFSLCFSLFLFAKCFPLLLLFICKCVAHKHFRFVQYNCQKKRMKKRLLQFYCLSFAYKIFATFFPSLLSLYVFFLKFANKKSTQIHLITRTNKKGKMLLFSIFWDDFTNSSAVHPMNNNNHYYNNFYIKVDPIKEKK